MSDAAFYGGQIVASRQTVSEHEIRYTMRGPHRLEEAYAEAKRQVDAFLAERGLREGAQSPIVHVIYEVAAL